MSDLGYPKHTALSKAAVSNPFKLFTSEAVHLMRQEAFSRVVKEHYTFSNVPGQKHIRGYVPKHAPFIEQAWRNHRVLSAISNIAEVDLIPACDYEIGHIRIVAGRGGPHEVAASWHKDAYPFVCILMLEDRHKRADEISVCGASSRFDRRLCLAQAGMAIVLHGGALLHKAPQPISGLASITMVTSFRPKAPLTRFDMRLHAVRLISHRRSLYHQYVDFRLDLLRRRIENHRKQIGGQSQRSFDVHKTKKMLKGLRESIERTEKELVDEHPARGIHLAGVRA